MIEEDKITNLGDTKMADKINLYALLDISKIFIVIVIFNLFYYLDCILDKR